jgi:hypothetical protein
MTILETYGLYHAALGHGGRSAVHTEYSYGANRSQPPALCCLQWKGTVSGRSRELVTQILLGFRRPLGQPAFFGLGQLEKCNDVRSHVVMMPRHTADSASYAAKSFVQNNFSSYRHFAHGQIADKSSRGEPLKVCKPSTHSSYTRSNMIPWSGHHRNEGEWQQGWALMRIKRRAIPHWALGDQVLALGLQSLRSRVCTSQQESDHVITDTIHTYAL